VSRVVWKFPIAIGPITTISIPSSDEDHPHKPLAVLAGLDPATGGPALWIELDPDAPRVDRHFVVRGTGHPIDEDEIHVGSLIDRNFVWHIYERHS